MKRNLQIIIAYRGTQYNGWQVQPNGLGIQEVIQKAVYQITGETVPVTASGRTDAGVHALGQSAHFITESKIPVDRIALALNTKLPLDVRVVECIERPIGFHSRYSVIEKTYLYKIYQGRIGDPFTYDLAYQIPYDVNWKHIENVSSVFLGKHDFKGFMSTGSSVKTTVREIKKIEFNHFEDIHEISFTGNGFLYNMVRILVGTLIEAGVKEKSITEMTEVLQSGQRKMAGPTAPACGLYLKEVKYE